MKIEWDRHKQQTNLGKHGIEFADAVAVLGDPQAVTIEDPMHDEQRFVTMGRDFLGRVLVVVYTYREPDSIRMISARTADRTERKQYEG